MYRRHLTVLSVIVVALFIVGCSSDALVRKENKVTVCSQCYSQAVQLRARSWKAGPDRVVSRHQCSDCGREMTTYIHDGKAMIKCAKCAPEGVACDRCVPPSGNPS